MAILLNLVQSSWRTDPSASAVDEAPHNCRPKVNSSYNERAARRYGRGNRGIRL